MTVRHWLEVVDAWRPDVVVNGAQIPTAQLYGPVLCRVPGAHGRIALTCDDGPNPAYTPWLLEHHTPPGTRFVTVPELAAA